MHQVQVWEEQEMTGISPAVWRKIRAEELAEQSPEWQVYQEILREEQEKIKKSKELTNEETKKDE